MRISDWSSDVCSSDLRDLIVDRTAGVTEGNAAIHAARRLHVEFFVRERFQELVPGADALLRLDVAAVPARELQKSGGLAHVAGSYSAATAAARSAAIARSEAHTSELQSLMRISYAVSCLKKQN